MGIPKYLNISNIMTLKSDASQQAHDVVMTQYRHITGTREKEERFQCSITRFQNHMKILNKTVESYHTSMTVSGRTDRVFMTLSQNHMRWQNVHRRRKV